jgi:hypothetical protein
MPTTNSTITSTSIVITPIVATINVLEEQHVLAFLSLPSSELDVSSSLSAALFVTVLCQILACLWVWHSRAYLVSMQS